MMSPRKIWNYFCSRPQVWADRIEIETEERRKEQEVKKFDKPILKVAVMGIVGLAIILVITHVLPGKDLYTNIKEHPELYTQLTQTTVFLGPFDSTATGPHLKSPQMNITLPDIMGTKVSSFLARNKYNQQYGYLLKFNILENRKNDQQALVIPKVYGDAKIYLDNKLADEGTSFFPIINTPPGEHTLWITINKKNAEKHGIRALYPPVLCSYDKVRSITKEREKGYYNLINTESVLASVLIVCGFFFIFSIHRPELLAFILYVSINIYYIYLQQISLNEQIRYSTTIKTIIDMINPFFLYWFFLEFFRFKKSKIIKLLTLSFISTTTISTIIAFILSHYYYKNFQLTLWLCQSIGFFLFISFTSLQIFTYLRKNLSNKKRYFIFIIINTSLLISFISNITTTLSISSQYNANYDILNQLSLLLLMTIAISAEFSKRDRERDDLLLNMPKELQYSLTHSEPNSNDSTGNEGFLILIDSIGWSLRQERLTTLEEHRIFQENIHKYLFKTLNHTQFSIISGTGDGYYFAYEGDFSLEAEIIERLTQLLIEPVKLSSLGIPFFTNYPELNLMHFRAALTYGKYQVGRVRYEQLTRDYTVSPHLARLARICKQQTPSLRLLSNPEDRKYLRLDGHTLLHEKDKHGFSWSFFELTVSDLIAKKINRKQ